MTTRLFVSSELSNGSELVLNEDQAKYLGRVLRLTVGDPISVFNGNCGEWSARIETISKNHLTLRVMTRRDMITESGLRTHLIQGISRGERMDFVVQKATELGVERITPVFTDHGVVKLDGKRATSRHTHWQSVATSATEQSGRIRPPLVEAPIALNKWFAAKESADSTELILKPDASTPLAATNASATKLCLLVGSEGGFSEREYQDAKLAGFKAVSLGPRVLRTETAALAALTVAQCLWGDLGNH